jgi:hypothetical protein
MSGPRENALTHALREAAADRQRAPDQELLETLAELCAQEPQCKPLGAMLASCFGKRAESAALPALPKLLWMAARADAFGLAHPNHASSAKQYGLDASDAFEAMAMRQLTGATCSLNADAARDLAAGPWSHEIGLLLNEANPQAAARWPWMAAMAGASQGLVQALSKAAPAPLEADANAAWLLACSTRDPVFLALAKKCPAPASEAASECAKLLSTKLPNARSRSACGIEKREAIERELIAQALLPLADSPALASSMLQAACVDGHCAPEGVEAPWRKTLLDAGATLSLGGAFKIIEEIQRQVASLGELHYHSASWTDARNALEASELKVVKLALSMGASKQAQGEPPAAILALEALPRACPPASKELQTALDRWAAQGFGAAALKWRKVAGGHTLSLGSSIATLPRRKEPGPNFEPQMKRWMQALARQGFDFEAKASPKSKSLGERLRSTASLKEFWPLVEAQVLSLQAAPAPKASRPGL